MARRRYQKGSVMLRNGNWTGRYLEDVRLPDGTVRRVHKRVFLGTQSDIPTRKLALRRLEPILTSVNSISYQPKHIVNFNEFVAKWEPLGMPKTETARNFKSILSKYLKPAFGRTQLSDITAEELQRFVSQAPISPSRMRTLLVCFRAIWKSARAWGYVSHNPFDNLILPKLRKSRVRSFTIEEIIQIVNAAEEPDKTLYWLLAQTGLRIGEALALTWGTVDIEKGLIEVRDTVARAKLRTDETKTSEAKRMIPISSALRKHLAEFRAKTWKPNSRDLLFANGNGNPWLADNLLARNLQPLLRKLNIPSGGFHAFRHASASILSTMKVPMEIRRARMGHTDEEMTLHYTHVLTEDSRRVADQFDEHLLPDFAAQDLPRDSKNIENIGK